MTDEVERQATALIERVFEFGSAVDAIEQGFQKREIETSAYRIANEIDSGERVVLLLPASRHVRGAPPILEIIQAG